MLTCLGENVVDNDSVVHVKRDSGLRLALK